MDYIEIEFSVFPGDLGKEILAAELNEIGFEAFSENENSISAFIQKDNYNEKKVAEIGILNSPTFKISYNKKIIKHTNWNEEWENNFKPVVILNKCIVRAAFHQVKRNFDYEIIIQPKMSFGTGHHETTFLMLSHMLKMGVKSFGEKDVLDAGCGSGILSILASQLGAGKIMAIDIDDWSVKNSKENIAINQCGNIRVKKGDLTILGRKKFNIILANINKNVLLESMASFNNFLDSSGLLLMSGFYSFDFPILLSQAHDKGFRLKSKSEKNHWTMAVFSKIRQI